MLVARIAGQSGTFFRAVEVAAAPQTIFGMGKSSFGKAGDCVAVAYKAHRMLGFAALSTNLRLHDTFYRSSAQSGYRKSISRVRAANARQVIFWPTRR
ncbi:MAG: hypothetical protein ACR2RB_12440 [Gammaproteobacteria bacterium]